jgi:hypothetical protein
MLARSRLARPALNFAAALFPASTLASARPAFAATPAIVTAPRRGVASLERFFRTEFGNSTYVVPADTYGFHRRPDGTLLSAGPRARLNLPSQSFFKRIGGVRIDPQPVHLLYMQPMRFLIPEATITTSDSVALSIVSSIQVRVITPALAFEMASNVQSTFPLFAQRALRASLATIGAEELQTAVSSREPLQVPALAHAQEALSAMISPLGFTCESISVLAANPVPRASAAAAAKYAGATSALRVHAVAQLELARARAAGVASVLAAVEDPALRAQLQASSALSDFVFLGPREGAHSDPRGPAAVALTDLHHVIEAQAAADEHARHIAAATAAAAATGAPAPAPSAAPEPAALAAAAAAAELDRVGGSVRAAFLEKNGGGETPAVAAAPAEHLR